MRKRFSVAVIGAGGFIGSNIVDVLTEKKGSVFKIVRQTSISDIEKQSFDIVFFCAGNSKTFLSQKDPLKCLQLNVGDLYNYLTYLQYKKFVYISSVAVYPQTNTVRTETFPIDISQLSIYGAHKYLGERYVREFAKSWLIIRATGFFGKGLKKNLLFDLRHNKQNIYLKQESWIDYMPIDWFCNSLCTLADKVENEIINVGSGQPIILSKIVSIKDLQYVFHEERLQDDRGISFEKFRHYILNVLSHRQLREMIEEFVLSAN